MEKQFKTILKRISALSLASTLVFNLSVPANVTAAEADNLTKVHIIDVGQGSAVLVQNDGENVLIDTGLEKMYDELSSYLTSIKVSEIDTLVITHPDADHMGGADLVIENYGVDEFYSCDYASTTNEYKEMMSALEAADITPKYVTEGDVIEMGELEANVFSPQAGVSYSDPNSASVVLQLVDDERKFLLMGDAPAKVEGIINETYDVKSDVLLVGHHGSDTSSAVNFIKEVAPEYAVISVGAENNYGHPDSNVLNRLVTYSKKVLRTDENGTVVFTTDGKTLDAEFKGKATVGETNAKISATKATLYKGAVKTLKVTGTESKVTWSSSDKTIAKVSSSGKVTALKEGNCTITAKIGDVKKLTCKITVKDRTLNATKASIYMGSSKTLKLSKEIDGVKWTSSDSDIAKVSSSGKVIGKKAGSCTITAKVNGVSWKCKVTVKTRKISATKATIRLGKTKTLKLDPEVKATWSTSNKDIATVSSSGKITPKKVGSCTITAKVNGVSWKCKVTVKKKLLDKLIGNPKSKIYHTVNCGSLPTKNKKTFESEKAAKNAGYKKCSKCAKQ